jgi:hypothetical protein
VYEDATRRYDQFVEAVERNHGNRSAHAAVRTKMLLSAATYQLSYP